MRKFQYQKTMLNKQHGIFLDSPLNKLSDTLFTLTTFRMLFILLVSRLCIRRSSFTWSQCRMHMNRMCAGSPGIASAMDLGFISVMRNLITFSSSSPENSIIPRILCCLNCGRGGRRSYQSEHKNQSIICCLQKWLRQFDRCSTVITWHPTTSLLTIAFSHTFASRLYLVIMSLTLCKTLHQTSV